MLSNAKGNVAPLLCLIIILIVGVVFCLQSKNLKNSTQTSSASQDKVMEETYKNRVYGFEISYPQNKTIEISTSGQAGSYDQYTRIQNYTDEEVINNKGVLKDEYYWLEIYIYDHKLGSKMTKSCEDSLTDFSKVDLGEGIMGYQGKGLSGGDSGAYPAICVNTSDVDYFVTAADGSGVIVDKIIKSFKFVK